MKKNVIKLTLHVCLIFGACCEVAFAIEQSPQEVVSKYYTADLNGFRLGGQTYDGIGKLYIWQHEPGWDSAFIVDEVKIYNLRKISDILASVEVKYHVIGIFGGDDFDAYDFYELVNFILVRDGNNWKIKEPIIPPHISPSSAIRQIEEIVRSESDITRQENLRHTAERIKDSIEP